MRGLEMKYFVIKPKAKDGLDMYARASQDAIIAYSERIRTENPFFADQLLVWAEKEKSRQDGMTDKKRPKDKIYKAFCSCCAAGNFYHMTDLIECE